MKQTPTPQGQETPQISEGGIRLKRVWQFNWVTDGEKPSGKSMTVPNEAYTIEELLTKYTQGLPLNTKEGLFPDLNEEDVNIEDIDLEAFNRLDITEREEILRDLERRIAHQEANRKQIEKLEEKEAEPEPKKEPKKPEKFDD